MLACHKRGVDAALRCLKYATSTYAVTLAIEVLSEMVWTCLLAPGTLTDALIWNAYGSSHTHTPPCVRQYA